MFKVLIRHNLYRILSTGGSAYQLVSCFIMKKANDRSEDSGAQPEVLIYEGNKLDKNKVSK